MLTISTFRPPESGKHNFGIVLSVSTITSKTIRYSVGSLSPSSHTRPLATNSPKREEKARRDVVKRPVLHNPEGVCRPRRVDRLEDHPGLTFKENSLRCGSSNAETGREARLWLVKLSSPGQIMRLNLRPASEGMVRGFYVGIWKTRGTEDPRLEGDWRRD
ncbi:hypothetical protein AVEN_264516-1 [Araneus ventricosus]|uniref:Uncharacterized protein n=1 Tax=Araneus ventricosus TaxID=182803 RepID=A0A4Y2JAM5_ARAVE|nr:hypothetical protein AVEN_264516-1 [Araneus ventricosus]